MDLQVIIRVIVALVISLGLAYHGKRKKSLNSSGSIAAIFVGFSTFAVSYRFGFLLIIFYYTSSKLTKVKEDIKAKLESDYAKGGQRNWIQVFANSILATLASISFIVICGEDSEAVSFQHAPTQNISKNLRAHLICAVLSHYACATADTWASELGILSRGEPRLITTLFLRKVPPGTNGGMSQLGTLASLAGGLLMGLVNATYEYFACTGVITYRNWLFSLVFGALMGLLGSILDSLLGATMQATYYCTERKQVVKTPRNGSLPKSVNSIGGWDLLSNEAVNLWSIALTMLLSIALAPTVWNFIGALAN